MSASEPILAAAPAAPAETPRPVHRVIEPRSGWQVVRLGEVWEFRDLLFLMALRDVSVRYKQTVLGVLWAVIQPVLYMIVFTALFRRSNVPDTIRETLGRDVPYPIFLFSGLLTWTLFASTVNAASNSLVANANMLRKVFFPRLIMPLAATGSPIADFTCSLVVLLALMWWYATGVTPALALLPLAAASALLAACGVGILFSAMTVKFRDIRFVVPFLVQIWLFVSCVVTPIQQFPEKYHWLLRLNPAYGPVQLARAAVLGTAVPWGEWAVSAAVSAVLLVAALLYFHRVERDFADVV